ncbi:hypothetical protein ACUH94_07990 [Dermabacteraceae bacterium P7074]
MRQAFRTRGRLNGPARGMMVVFVLVALLMGVLLSRALVLSTSAMQESPASSGAVSADVPLSTNALPIVSPLDVGKEVESVVSNGRAGSSAPFKVSDCLGAIDVSETALALEQVQWGQQSSPGWLILHSTRTLADIRSTGGSVNAVVVSQNCTAKGDTPPQVYWSGTVMVGAVKHSDSAARQ